MQIKYWLTPEMCSELVNDPAIPLKTVSEYLTLVQTSPIHKTVWSSGAVYFQRGNRNISMQFDDCCHSTEDYYHRVVLVRLAFGDVLLNPEDAPVIQHSKLVESKWMKLEDQSVLVLKNGIPIKLGSLTASRYLTESYESSGDLFSNSNCELSFLCEYELKPLNVRCRFREELHFPYAHNKLERPHEAIKNLSARLHIFDAARERAIKELEDG